MAFFLAAIYPNLYLNSPRSDDPVVNLGLSNSWAGVNRFLNSGHGGSITNSCYWCSFSNCITDRGSSNWCSFSKSISGRASGIAKCRGSRGITNWGSCYTIIANRGGCSIAECWSSCIVRRSCLAQSQKTREDLKVNCSF